MPLTKIVTGVITDGTITSTDMAVDPRNASNLNAGDVPLAQLDNVEGTTGLEEDIALLAFKTQANGNLARYNLVDQSVDSFEDASGVDASTSTGEARNATGKYYSGTSYGAYTINAFTSTGANTWTCPANTQEAEVLIVGGGGGGAGEYYAGGGGAGGIVHDTDYAVTAGVVYDITVGTGGGGGNASTMGTDGADSVWNVNAEGSGITLTASGGGGSSYNAGTGGKAGGSGGGGGGGSSPALNAGASDQASFPGALSYGNAGGVSDASNGAGGGGAGGAGSASVHPNGGNGGVGKEFTNFAAYGTDASNTSGATPGSGSGKGYFGGGGGGSGGGHPSPTQATGGAGGGGNGGRYTPATLATDAYANTGGGGGGGSHAGNGGPYGQGKAGGSGIVLLRHRTETYNNMSLVSNAQTAQAQPTKADVVLTYTNGAGTATINTDLIASVSRDGGTTYTTVTLASKGTTGGHNILSASDVSISGQPAGTSMVWKVATANQSATKDTRIHGVSLGWS